jgi:hypothetical protein
VGLNESLLHFPAWLEGNDWPFRHGYLFSCAGVPRWSGLALFDLEHAKVGNAHATFVYERLDNSAEEALRYLFILVDYLGHHFCGPGLLLLGRRTPRSVSDHSPLYVCFPRTEFASSNQVSS